MLCVLRTRRASRSVLRSTRLAPASMRGLIRSCPVAISRKARSAMITIRAPAPGVPTRSCLIRTLGFASAASATPSSATPAPTGSIGSWMVRPRPTRPSRTRSSSVWQCAPMWVTTPCNRVCAPGLIITVISPVIPVRPSPSPSSRPTSRSRQAAAPPSPTWPSSRSPRRAAN